MDENFIIYVNDGDIDLAVLQTLTEGDNIRLWTLGPEIWSR